jgi:hypothetical protein
MVFQSPMGIRKNKNVQLSLFITLMIAICLFFICTKLQAPARDAVDGVYKNQCCKDIIIRDGHVLYGGITLDMKLVTMKFGLTGYVDGKFTSRGAQDSKESTAMIFAEQDGERTVSLPIDRQDRTFNLVSSVETM